MVGSYQCALEFYRAGLYGALTGREKVNLTLTFLLDDLFFQALDGLGMSPLKWVSLGSSPDLCVPDGHGAKGFGFPDGMGAGGLSFLDSCRAEGFSILGGIGSDGSGFLDGFCCFRIILAKLQAQLPNCFPPMGIDGWLAVPPGPCWPSLGGGLHLWEGCCCWALVPWLWERWQWGFPLGRLPPSQHHPGCSPGMMCPPA